MKQASLFISFIAALWPSLGLFITEKVNGQTNGEAQRTYLHKTMLREVYSSDQKWEGTSANTVYVAADVVALDSPLPVKARPSVGTSSGKLPKIGMKKALSETDITAIDTMKAQLLLLENTPNPSQSAIATQKSRILRKLTDDAVYCSVGIDEKLEAAFLEGISNGVALVEDENNTGTGLRANYGYLKENTIGVQTVGEVSDEDIKKVIDKADADGNTIQYIMLAQSTYNKMRQTQWAKELVANYKGQTFDEDTKLAVPSAKQFDEAFADDYNGIQFIKVNRTVIFEKNGKKNPVKPFNADHLIFLTSQEVGSLVYGTLAEENHRVNGVEYSTVDTYKLISKFSINEPLQEWTTGQAIALPVIEDVDSIYMLDITTNEVLDEEAEAEDENDTSFTYKGQTYTKAVFVAALNKVNGGRTPASAKDETLLAKVNDLSVAQKEQLDELLAAS